MGGKPKAPALQQPKLNATEKATQKQLGQITGQYANILGDILPQYQQYSQQASQMLPQRLEQLRGVEGQITELSPKVSVLSPEFQKSLAETIGLKKQQAQTSLEDIYKPLEAQTTANLYKRLGGLQSSIATEAIAKLASERQKTASQLATGIEADRATLEQNQLNQQNTALQNLYNLQNYLSGQATTPLSFLQGASGQGMGYTTGTQSAQQQNAISLADAINKARTQQFQNEMTRLSTPSPLQQWAQIAANAAATAATAMSDIKTKQNIKKIGQHKGINFYTFEYKPEYNQPKGLHTGVMAQEVKHIPNVVTSINEIKHVNYTELFRYLKEVV